VASLPSFLRRVRDSLACCIRSCTENVAAIIDIPTCYIMGSFGREASIGQQLDRDKMVDGDKADVRFSRERVAKTLQLGHDLQWEANAECGINTHSLQKGRCSFFLDSYWRAFPIARV
jgi:hypothetical protein